MLKQRVITAVVLLLVFLLALWSPSPLPFVGLTLLLIGAGAWEWSRLNGLQGASALASAGGLVVALALAWMQADPSDSALFWGLLTLCWSLLTLLMLRSGVSRWSTWPQAWRLGLGWLLLAGSWWALVQVWRFGIDTLLSVLALVWMADIAAYFAGRAFGRRKLAVRISPGKSWEGAIGGVLGVWLLAALWIGSGGLDGQAHNLYAHLWQLGPWVAVPGLLLLSVLGVTGDLIESLVKRSAGVKDSSQLLPGHGGVLDRVDALLPVLPAAMWLLSL